MVRPALSASRGIDIVDFLARFPGREFTLSEIVKGTEINLASCHAVLNALSERGYVSRDPSRKAYRLGPALIAMGQAALASQPLIGRASEAAQALSRELDIPTLISTVIGEEIVGIVACNAPDGRNAGLNVGERMPLVPPVGASFLAWSDEKAIAAWLARASADHDPALIEFWRSGLTQIRQRSFQVELSAPDSSAHAARMEEMAAGSQATQYKRELVKFVHSWGRHPMQPESIEPATAYDLILIAAPIFDRDGRCAYNLCLGGFNGAIGGDKVMALGNRLVATCLQVMEADRARN